MADDRYNWLDEETAERMLRGLSVDAQATGPGEPDGRSPAQPGMRNPQDDPRTARASRSPSGKGRRPERKRKTQDALGVPGEAWFRAADRQTADRLASALGALAAEHSTPPAPARGATSVELPGEAAALDAFRAAHLGVLRSGSVGVPERGDGSASGSASGGGTGGSPDAAGAGAGPGLGPGQDGTGGGGGGRRRGRGRSGGDGRGPGRRARSVLVGRPLRAGFAVALAGCALGGVAVAAGTGVLPTPFGSGNDPAVTVSPVASPGDQRSRGAPQDGTDGTGPGDRDRDTSGGRHDRERGPGGDDDHSGSDDLADSGSGGAVHKGREGARRGRGGHEAEKNGKGDKGSKGNKGNWDSAGGGNDRENLAVALCDAYSEGKLSSSDRRRLERAAGGRTVVQKFCARYGGGSGSGGSAESGGTGGGHDDSGGSGDSGGAGDGGGDGGSGSGGEGGSGGDGGTGGSGSGSGGGSGGSSAGAPSTPGEPSPTAGAKAHAPADG